MSARNNGGPAFPIADAQTVHHAGAAACVGLTDPVAKDAAYTEATLRAAAGMTLRDYFAGKAITGTNPGGAITDADVAKYAAWAYRMADAMLAERAK